MVDDSGRFAIPLEFVHYASSKTLGWLCAEAHSSTSCSNVFGIARQIHLDDSAASSGCWWPLVAKSSRHEAVGLLERGDRAMASQLRQIKYVVQLMLENRSFDQMLGFLYADSQPPNQSPAGHPYDGLTGQESNVDSAGNKMRVFRIDRNHPNAYLMPGCNPKEGFEATNLQLFGVDHPAANAQPTNGGFVISFERAIAQDQGRPRPEAVPGTKPSDIMGMYDPSMLPVMSALAREFAVCDAWFSSAPTETYPNRAFACTGTSLGHLKDDFKFLNTPSIFGRLSDAGLDWAAYGYNSKPFIRTDYPDTKSADPGKFGIFSDFQQRAKAGTLPAYTFLEPAWGGTGNSQHPITDVALGEKLILDVYRALQTGAGWNQTLLLITYDEHGGNYDHVAPPHTATAPDQFRGDVDHLDFDFTRFGVRVPAVLVSPLIERGTVFRASQGVIDHTSVLATLRERWPAIKSLGKRDAAAPSLGDVLTLKAPRQGDPLANVTAPSSSRVMPNANQATKLQMLQAAKVANLQVRNEHGTFDHDQPDLKNANEVAEYIRDRTAAWEDQTNRRRKALTGAGAPRPSPQAPPLRARARRRGR
jgi:phospholipase C